jgi:hypothetical protein
LKLPSEEQKKERMKKSDLNPRDLWDHHQVYEHMCYGSTRSRRGESIKRIFE